VVLGTAGSGKTTLAVHRACYLAHPDTDHCGRTLLVTFNRCLVSYLQSLTGTVPRDVVVENYHKFARGYLASRGRMRRGQRIAGPDIMKEICHEAVAEARDAGVSSSVLRRPVELLVEEFRWLAQRGIATADDYVTAERVGREGTRIVRTQRRAVFDVYDRYRALRAARGKDYDWQDLSHAVLDELAKDTRPRRYRHVVIDEGQDLSPMELRSLAAAVRHDGSLTFFGDMAQQIYGHKMSWRGAGLNVKEVWKFEENYRNTRQIAQLALVIANMPDFPDEADLVAPKAPVADGPLPALVSFRNEAAENRFVAQLAARLAQTGTVGCSCATASKKESSSESSACAERVFSESSATGRMARECSMEPTTRRRGSSSTPSSFRASRRSGCLTLRTWLRSAKMTRRLVTRGFSMSGSPGRGQP